MSRDVNTKAARTEIGALEGYDDKVARANKRRAKMKKMPISRSKAIAVAEKRLTIQDLVEA